MSEWTQVTHVVFSKTISGTRYSIFSITQCSKLMIYFTVMEFVLELIVIQLARKFPGCVINEVILSSNFFKIRNRRLVCRRSGLWQ
jgi:hypothetical protein